MSYNTRISTIYTLLFLSAILSFVPQLSAQTSIDVDNSNIQWIGRVKDVGTKNVTFDWLSTGFLVSFQGTSFGVTMQAGFNQEYFNLSIDGGANTLVTWNNSDTTRTLVSGLANATHTAQMTRRVESFGGHYAHITKIVLDTGKTLAAPSAAPARKMEFVGDSITVGYGNEGDASHDSALYNNNYYAYGAITARHFNAQYHCEAKSGYGLLHNNSDSVLYSTTSASGHTAWPTMPFLFGYSCEGEGYIIPPAYTWNFSSWTPDVLVIYLGLNDHLGEATTPPGLQPTQQQFEDAYYQLYKWLFRARYPNAQIFLVWDSKGPTWKPGTAQGDVAIRDLVSKLTAEGDSKVHYIDLNGTQGGSGAESHPNVAEHQAMANVVIAGIESVMHWDSGGTYYSLTGTINPSGAGTISMNPSGGSYTAGTAVTLTANANSGYSFSSWSGSASGVSNPTTVTVNSNSSATANFSQVAPNTYTLSVNANPIAGGTVSVNPFAASYTAGTVVTLTATANAGYTFASWTGSAGGTSASAQVTMDANKTATAVFTQDQQPPVTAPPPGGTIVNGMYNYSDATGNSTDFVVNLSQPGTVEMKIYTVTGKTVNSLSQSGAAGDNTFAFSNMLSSGKRLSGGLYVYSIVVKSSDGAAETKTGKFLVR